MQVWWIQDSSSCVKIQMQAGLTSRCECGRSQILLHCVAIWLRGCNKINMLAEGINHQQMDLGQA